MHDRYIKDTIIQKMFVAEVSLCLFRIKLKHRKNTVTNDIFLK